MGVEDTMMDLDDREERTTTRGRSSARPIRAGGGHRTPAMHREAQKIIDTLGGPRTQRASVPQQQQRRSARQPAPETWEDEQVTPSTRPGRTTVVQAYQPPRRQWHPLLWVGLTLVVLVLLWVVTTIGAAWLTSHLSDPGQFGPTHGNIVTGVFGGGDGQANPSKLIALNNAGHVEIIKITANDSSKAQIIPGPNLITLDFPDPNVAEVQLQTGDFNGDGKLDLRVTILSTVFDFPLHRYQQNYTLYGDGKGSLKPQVAGGQ